MSKIALTSVCNITTGKLDSNAAVEDGQYPYFTCAPEPLRINEYAFDCDAILLAGNNASGDFHCQKYNGKFNAYQRTYVITAKEGYDLDYIYYSICINLIQLKLKSQGSQTKFLTMGILNSFEVDELELEEQKQIVSSVKNIDCKIEINKKIREELLGLIKTIYDYWFIQFDYPDINGKPYKSSGGNMVFNDTIKLSIPEGWSVKCLCELENDIVTGKTPSTKEEDNFNGDIPFVTIDDIRGNIFISSTSRTLSKKGADSQRSKYIPDNTICVSCIASPGLVGFTTKQSQTNQQINSVICSKDYNRIFLYYAIKQSFISTSGAKSGNIFKNMNKDDFSNIKIIYSEDVVKAFDNKVSNTFKMIKRIELENQRLSEFRDYLLPFLMNGQVSIK